MLRPLTHKCSLTTGPSLTNLNQDVTAIILGLIASKRDLSSLTKTCRTLRSSAERHLLADFAVKTYAHGKSFCRFMLAEDRRDPRLRSLQQLSFYLHPGVARKRKARLIYHLINVLQGARFLRFFSTNEPVLTGLMLRTPELAKAISHIEELDIYNGKGQEVKILTEVPLSLRKLTIRFQGSGLSTSSL